MVSAGIVSSNDTLAEYNDTFKMGKSLLFIIFKLSDNKKEFIIETKGLKTAKDQKDYETEYDDFLKALPSDQCRIAVVDFRKTTEGGERSKIVGLAWNPEGAKIKDKMIYASSKEGFMNQLNPDKRVHGAGYDEVDYETISKKLF